MERKKSVIKYLGYGQDYWHISEPHIKTCKVQFSQWFKGVFMECNKRRSCWWNPPWDAIVAYPERFDKFTVRYFDKAL